MKLSFIRHIKWQFFTGYQIPLNLSMKHYVYRIFDALQTIVHLMRENMSIFILTEI